MYLNHIIIYLILFIFVVFLTNRRININTLLFLLVLGFIIYFFGIFVIKYFWILLLIWLAMKLTGSPQKKKYNGNSEKYYRTFTGKEAEEFFNNFFRGNFDGNFSYTNQNSKKWHNYGGDFTEIYEDKYYEELGVGKNCSKDVLKEAYLKKVKEHHPDRYSDPTEKEYHEEKLKKINEAYDNLIKRYN